MTSACLLDIEEVNKRTAFTIALVGNPNVGKSTIFNCLTGVGVITANYPGTTVEVNIATTSWHGVEVALVDLPGTYDLGGFSETEQATRQVLLECRSDAVLVILDATNLSRNLYLLLMLRELGLPLLAALNMSDQAEKKGLFIDGARLSKLLGLPVIPTVASRGEGLELLMREAAAVAAGKYHPSSPPLESIGPVQKEILSLESSISGHLKEIPFGLSPGALAHLVLAGDEKFLELTAGISGGEEVLADARLARTRIRDFYGEDVPALIPRERHGLAGSISAQVTSMRPKKGQPLQSLFRAATAPFSGTLILAGLLAFIFTFLFYAGNFLSTVLNHIWMSFFSPLITGAIYFYFKGSLAGAALKWALDDGLMAAVTVGIPYVLTFYIIMGFLEDSGYLNTLAFLTDQVLHKFGLHGGAAIPIMSSIGCNVPAIMGLSTLGTIREKVLASILVVLTPCGARTAVIMGSVGLLIGWPWAMIIFFISASLIVLSGLMFNKFIPGCSSGLVLEVFPLRLPALKPMLAKTWFRFRDFLLVATPIVLVGSLVLGILYETGWIWKLTRPLAPVFEGLLGIPAVAGLTLIFALLRKELALQLLVTFAAARYGAGIQSIMDFMTSRQIFVYALVNTIYLPCLATLAVMAHVLGWKRALWISAFTLVLALIAGTATNFILQAFGMH
jgi:ferrous iron transport protein B